MKERSFISQAKIIPQSFFQKQKLYSKAFPTSKKYAPKLPPQANIQTKTYKAFDLHKAKYGIKGYKTIFLRNNKNVEAYKNNFYNTKTR